MYGAKINGVMWVLDPNQVLNEQPEVTLSRLGLIPNFIDPESEDLVGTALARYSFGGPPMGGKIESDGTFRYPGDPPLQPVASAVVLEQQFTIYVYNYGIIGFVKGDEQSIYRFD